MGDVLFVWTAAYQTCLKRPYVPRLLSGLYQMLDLCLIKHILTVWPLTSTLACLVTKQCLMVFCRQTFIVCPGPKTYNRIVRVGSPVHKCQRAGLIKLEPPRGTYRGPVGDGIA